MKNIMMIAAVAALLTGCADTSDVVRRAGSSPFSPALAGVAEPFDTGDSYGPAGKRYRAEGGAPNQRANIQTSRPHTPN